MAQLSQGGESPPLSWDDIVLDTSAFIQGEIEPLRVLCKRLWTIPEVLAEVLDKRAKSQASFAFDVLPNYVQQRSPKRESIEYVVEFSKRTGDFPQLSKTDLLVLALTHELRQTNQGTTSSLDDVKDIAQGEDQEDEEEEEGAIVDARSESIVVPGKSWASVLGGGKISQIVQQQEPEAPSPPPPISTKSVMWSDEDFAIKPAKSTSAATTEDWPSLPVPANPAKVTASVPWDVTAKRGPTTLVAEVAPPATAVPAVIPEAKPSKRDPTSSRILSLSTSGGAGGQKAEDDHQDLEWAKPGSGASGWGGAAASSASLRLKKEDAPSSSSSVACATADFALQNVLLQLKLCIVSLDGRRITQVKNWVLKCDACLRIFPATEHRIFCPHCGHQTLSRLAYSIDSQGNRRYHYSKSRRVKTKGNVFPIPKNADLLLREDQLLSGIWAQRASRKQSSVSMFGEDVNDAMGLNLKANAQVKVGYGAQNPNSRKGRERRGAKKKSSG